MAAGAYMGAGEASALVGVWQELVGRVNDTRGNYAVGADLVLGPRPAQYQQPAPYYPPPYYPPPPQYVPPEQYRNGRYRDANVNVEVGPGQHRHHHHHHQGYSPYWQAQRQEARREHDLRNELAHRFGGGVVRGDWQNIVGQDPIALQGIGPRNFLEDAQEPSRAGREVLPMSVDGPILPGQSAQITARPQRVAFRPERVFISAASDATLGAAAWLVNDIKIGNRSQFSQSGSVPGDMFATVAIDSFVSFETAQTAMDVVMVVTYIGTNSDGVSFYGAIIGTAAV